MKREVRQSATERQTHMNVRTIAIQWRVILAVLLILFLSTSLLKAAFQIPIHSVKSASLGSTFVNGESSSLFLNPSGLSPMSWGEVNLTYAKPFAGLPEVAGMSLGSLSLAIPTRFGTMGLGVAQFEASGLKRERTIS